VCPLSNYEAQHPEQLWDWLETAAGGPDNALAITHNANFSNGQMFNPRYSDGQEIDETYARRRALWEPLAEMFQSKGSSTADLRLYGVIEGGIPSVLLNPAGLTGIWAEENTRDSLFDGLRRRETFATSGVRLMPRLFGGWHFDVADLEDVADAGYRGGVPMGAELPLRPAGAGAPTLLVHAAKDPQGANLDRIQIVKCWTARGQLFEKVFDVAASEGRTPHPTSGMLPLVGTTVDIARATYTNDIGATELSAAWTDPDFDATLACTYYARILEIPTPRWSTYDAVKHRRRFPPASRPPFNSAPGPRPSGTHRPTRRAPSGRPWRACTPPPSSLNAASHP
jgi:hypothetical protein